jgi:pantetheine-phosphate adenylyltransferase
MKVAVYSGTFSPWHEGHEDILTKALQVFDKVIICVGYNPDKVSVIDSINKIPEQLHSNPRIEVHSYNGLMVDFIDNLIEQNVEVTAMVRGIRNAQDLEYERATQYHNEDLSCRVPTVYFICDRELVHISSSAIRTLQKLGVR